MKILVINGPNLNMLGKRDSKHYGTLSLSPINESLQQIADKEKVELEFFQSNHEGNLIDFIQKQSVDANGILINPGALTHYGYSLRDCVEDCKLPTIVVHLSEVQKREEFRKIDVFEGIAIGVVSGLKDKSYEMGLEKLIAHIKQ